MVSPALLSAQVVMRLQTQDQDGGGPVVERSAVVLQGTGIDGNFQFHTYSTDGALPMAFNGLGGWGGMSADPSQLVFDPQVRNDLELDEDQVKQLKKIQRDFSKQMQEKMKFTSGPDADPKQYQKFAEIMKKIGKERQAAMGAILLPHQEKRLKQIATQMDMKGRGDANFLASKNMASELGIDDEQKKRLKKRAAEIKAEMEAEIAKIKEKGRDKLLKELKPSQRKQLEEMLGDKFERKQTNWRDRIEKLRKERKDD